METIAPEYDIRFMNLDDTDFGSMPRPEQIRHLQVKGYMVLPEHLDRKRVEHIKQELDKADTRHASYSENQDRSTEQPQWLIRTVAELIGYPSMIELYH